jgi:mRNA-degrading endonuclease toxin of MazEF toxin-antitoxin module
VGRGGARDDCPGVVEPGVVGIGREDPLLAPRRGDIHFIVFPDQGGNVLRGPHPAVVVQTDRMRRSSTVVVVPMTSTPRSGPEAPPYLVAVSGRASGLDRDGFVKCDQPATLPVAVLGARAGRLAPEAIEGLDAALRFVLEI